MRGEGFYMGKFYLLGNDIIYAIGGNSATIMYAPRLNLRRNDDKITIDDVICRNNSVGNGTMLMNALLAYAKLNHIKKIHGFLSSIDEGHRERQANYYKKFGFTVTKNNIEKTII